MNTSFKRLAIRTLAVSTLAAAVLGSANAAVFIRTGVVVTPVAPVVVVPTCRFVAVPVVNAWTGVTYMVTRRVCY
jgi:hypothetical protein